jgi:hypothetical protein
MANIELVIAIPIHQLLDGFLSSGAETTWSIDAAVGVPATAGGSIV